MLPNLKKLKRSRPLILLGIAMAILAGCSSSKTTEGPTGVDETPVTDAGTDAVPAASAENAPPVDLSTPPPADPNAPLAIAEGANPVPPPAPDGMGAPPPIDAAGEPLAPTAPPSMASQTASELSQLNSSLTPAPPSTPSLDSTTPSAFNGDTESYTVQQGDTLMKVAFEVYGDLFKWRAVYEMNRDRISNPAAIPAGTVLKVEKPSEPVKISRRGQKYLIKEGDTLGTISEDVYGTKSKWKKIWKNNKELIKDPNRIFAGFHLYYTMSPGDKQELEQFRNSPPEVAPQPMANVPPPAMPASSNFAPPPPENTTGAPAPGNVAPRQPASAGPVVTPQAQGAPAQ